MATRRDMLESLTIDDLKEVASDHDVDVTGKTVKADLVQAIWSDKSVKHADIAEYVEPEEGDDEGDEDTDDASSTDTPDVSDEDQLPPRGAGSPVHTLAMTELSQARVQDEHVQSGRLIEDSHQLARERVAGSTSDANTRREGVRAADVPADPPAAVHSTDAADYPFPPQGDVDVATVPKAYTQGEFISPLSAEAWVRLAQAPEVPERFWGHEAAVIDAPTVLCNCDHSPRTHEHPDPKALVTVRTRDEANATLRLPWSAFTEISNSGRPAVHA